MDPEDEFTLTPEEQAALNAAISGAPATAAAGAASGPTPTASLAGVPDWLSSRYAQAVRERNDAWDEYYKTPAEQRSFTGVAERVKMAETNVANLERQITSNRPKQPIVPVSKTNPYKQTYVAPTGQTFVEPNEYYDPDAAAKLQADIEESKARAASLRASAAVAGQRAPNRKTWQNPNNGATYIIDEDTGQLVSELSGAIPDWIPGVGVPAKPQDNPETIRHNQATESYQQSQLMQDQLNREAETMRNQLTNRVSLAGHIGQQMQAAWPYIVNPNDPTFQSGPSADGSVLGTIIPMGFGRGDVVERMHQMAGIATPYNPDNYRLPVVKFDPEVAWRLAQGLVQ